MEKYTLFFVGKEQDANNPHSAKNCSSCPIEEICPLVPRDTYFGMHVPSFEESKGVIEALYNNSTISFIFLVDNKENQGFIYKGFGTEQELKESYIKNVIEIIEQEVLAEQKNIKNPENIVIHDIRGTMNFYADPSVN